MANPNFSCDLNSLPEAFPHFWEHSVGSGHATLALRADWQRDLKQCHADLGFKFVRFHGIFNDDMSTLIEQDGKLIYSFFNADQIFDFLVSIGMKPLIELSFMPSALASGSKTVFHYKGNITQAKDENAWATLIEVFAKHLIERYGIDEVKTWMFEVWNEPDLEAFWLGSKEDYFRFYKVTTEKLKSVDARLKVGGPATSANHWIPEFLSFCKSTDTPVDFVSTHHYPTDALGMPGDDTISQLAASHRSILREQAKRVVTEARELPVYYTEWSSSSNPFDLLHDQAYAGAFITKTVMEAHGLVKGYSYWTFSDIFEENYFSSVPFHGGFGLMNIHGIPKPAYRAYQLMHELGEERIEVKGSHPTVDVWCIKKGSSLQVLAVNSQLPKHPIEIETIRIEIKNAHFKKLSIVRVDDESANAFTKWEQLNRPGVLSQTQLEEIKTGSELKSENLSFEVNGQSVFFNLTLPKQGVACATLER